MSGNAPLDNKWTEYERDALLRLTLCTCGWFRPATEPTCTKHVDRETT